MRLYSSLKDFYEKNSSMCNVCKIHNTSGTQLDIDTYNSIHLISKHGFYWVNLWKDGMSRWFLANKQRVIR